MEGSPANNERNIVGQEQSSERHLGGSRLQEIIAASGISVRVWRLYACFWLVCLLFPIVALIQAPPSTAGLLVTIGGLVIFTGTYFGVMWPHPLNEQARTRLGFYKSLSIIASLTVLTLLLAAAFGGSFLWLLIGVSAIAGMTLSFRNASIAVMALTLLTLGVSLAMSGGIAAANWLQVIPLVLLVRGLGLDMLGFVRLSDALRELHSAREELAQQAVVEERLRMARDLHDLLGHTLSLITLKSELAGRLLEKNPQAAKQEIREVERVARQALREVREAVAGYRQQTLRGELEGARQILEAAGIICNIEDDVGMLPRAVDTILAWVVREAVTNVIRHSRAQHCLIRIASTPGSACAEISNDGYPREEHFGIRKGSGLSGLTERVAEQGGQIEVGAWPAPDGIGFRLKVEVPLRSDPGVEAR